MKRTCAVCVRLSDDCEQESIGRDDAPVWVCARCRGAVGKPAIFPNGQRAVRASLPLIPPLHSCTRVRRDAKSGEIAFEVARGMIAERYPDAKFIGRSHRWWFFAYPDPRAPNHPRKVTG